MSIIISLILVHYTFFRRCCSIIRVFFRECLLYYTWKGILMSGRSPESSREQLVTVRYKRAARFPATPESQLQGISSANGYHSSPPSSAHRPANLRTHLPGSLSPPASAVPWEPGQLPRVAGPWLRRCPWPHHWNPQPWEQRRRRWGRAPRLAPDRLPSGGRPRIRASPGPPLSPPHRAAPRWIADACAGDGAAAAGAGVGDRRGVVRGGFRSRAWSGDAGSEPPLMGFLSSIGCERFVLVWSLALCLLLLVLLLFGLRLVLAVVVPKGTTT